MDEQTQQTMDNLKGMMDSMVESTMYDVRYALEEAGKRETELADERDRLQEEVQRLQTLANEQPDDIHLQFFLENCMAFWRAAEERRKTHDDVDALMWSQGRLNPDWEIKDWYGRSDAITYPGSEIRTMLIERGFRPEAIHIDDQKDYVMPHSPGGGAGLSRICNWDSAYYYKAMAHYAGVESVAITNLCTIIGIEERHQTAGARGIVNRFLRPYRVDPGDVLPREWNNSIIWPANDDYTEVRF